MIVFASFPFKVLVCYEHVAVCVAEHVTEHDAQYVAEHIAEHVAQQ